MGLKLTFWGEGEAEFWEEKMEKPQWLLHVIFRVERIGRLYPAEIHVVEDQRRQSPGAGRIHVAAHSHQVFP